MNNYVDKREINTYLKYTEIKQNPKHTYKNKKTIQKKKVSNKRLQF